MRGFEKRLAKLERWKGFLPFVVALPGQSIEAARVAAGFAPDAPNPMILIQFGRNAA